MYPGSKIYQQFELMCGYNMADSDHWVLYHSSSQVRLCVCALRMQPQTSGVFGRTGSNSYLSSICHYTTWWTSFHPGGSFPNPCMVNPNLHLPCGCLPDRHDLFLTAGKKKKKKRGQETETGCQRFRGCQPVFCCCLDEQSEEERWNEGEEEEKKSTNIGRLRKNLTKGKSESPTRGRL